MLDKILHMKIAESAWKDASVKECPGTAPWKILYEQKLIEAVVLECSKICDQQGRIGWNDDRKAQARLDRDLIVNHFGLDYE